LVAEIAAARTPFAYSPDGRHLLATMTGADGEPNTVAGFWDLASGRLLFTMPGHREPVGGVAMSPDGRLLATGLRPFPPPAGSSPPAEIKLWNAASGRLLATIIAGPPPTSVYNLDFSPDSRLLIMRGNGHGLVWDVTESPPRNRDDLIAETEDSSKNGRYLRSQSGPCYAADGPQWFVIGTGRRYLSVAAGPEAALRPLQLPRLFGVDSSVSDNRPPPKFGPGGRTLAVAVTADVPHYQSGPRGVLDRILRRPDRPERWSTVRLYDSATGRKLGTLPETAWYFDLWGFADEGQTIWTERIDRGENFIEAGDTRIFEQWPVLQPETPWWLLGVTALGILFVAADIWRMRRRWVARRVFGPVAHAAG
jgi:hypothetical protein